MCMYCMQYASIPFFRFFRSSSLLKFKRWQSVWPLWLVQWLPQSLSFIVSPRFSARRRARNQWDLHDLELHCIKEALMPNITFFPPPLYSLPSFHPSPTSLLSSLPPSLPPPLYPLQPIAQVIDSDEEVNKARNSINGGVETAGSKLLGYVKTWDE